MLEVPYIKFIHILKKFVFLNKMNKKILCFSITQLFSPLLSCPVQQTGDWRLEKGECKTKRVNQQETVLFESFKDKTGSSETTCDITYDFKNYLDLIPQHKKKIDQKFLE